MLDVKRPLEPRAALDPEVAVVCLLLPLLIWNTLVQLKRNLR
jgi:hypothetical protein